MTDNIIKSLEWLILCFPKNIPAKDNADRLNNCINLYCQNAVNELKRQNAEIARLEQGNLKQAMLFNSNTIENVRAEAITEFVERLKEEAKSFCLGGAYEIFERKIDQVAKEMKESVNNA